MVVKSFNLLVKDMAAEMDESVHVFASNREDISLMEAERKREGRIFLLP